MEVFHIIKYCGHYEIVFSQFQTTFYKIKKNKSTGCVCETVSNSEKHFRFHSECLENISHHKEKKSLKIKGDVQNQQLQVSIAQKNSIYTNI